MSPPMVSLLIVQVITFVGLGALYLQTGDWRLGSAQLLLAGVQAIIYSGSMA